MLDGNKSYGEQAGNGGMGNVIGREEAIIIVCGKGGPMWGGRGCC